MYLKTLLYLLNQIVTYQTRVFLCNFAPDRQCNLNFFKRVLQENIKKHILYSDCCSQLLVQNQMEHLGGQSVAVGYPDFFTWQRCSLLIALLIGQNAVYQLF